MESDTSSPDISVSGVKRGLASGTVWLICARLVVRVIGLCSTIILARLLVPEDFGLISLAAMAVGMVEMAGELGMEMALIRDQKASRNHYDTVWTIKIIIGVLTSSTLAILAIPLAVFFDEPRLQYILYALAFSLFISSFRNIGVVNFTKDLMFSKVFLQQAASKSANFIITISLALLWRNYWALVVGIMSTKILSTIFTYIIHPYRPRLCLSEWREIISFSKWVYVAKFSTFINKSSDRFVIGKLADAGSVGLFSVAFEISNLVSSEVIAPIKRVSFPAFSKLVYSPDELKSTYLQLVAVLVLVALPLATGILLTSDLLVHILLGDKWLAAIPLLGILAIYGILETTSSQARPLFMALNKPHIPAYLMLVKGLFFLTALFLGMYFYQLVGAAWACVITSLTFLIVDMVFIRQIAGISIRSVFSRLWRPSCSALAMSAVVVFFRDQYSATYNTVIDYILELILVALVGASTYIFACWSMWRLCGYPEGAEKMITDLVFKKILKR